ncbi:MAG: ATP-binding protein [Coriobacteriales bacterium]|jgi:predicted AAA+ superfamily ATPase|nr:ATP-binding protein [Coriobacteriales bacterium]
MSSVSIPEEFERKLVSTITARMHEPRRFMQIVTGPRQTGKTTAIKQALRKTAVPYRFASADVIATQSSEWLESEWQQARDLVSSNNAPALIVLDEVQNIRQWPSTVKALWDEDAWTGTDLRVVLSGSSTLLLQKGLSESLTGRFEILRSTHWSYPEMRQAFNYSFQDFLSFGGYPAGAALKSDPERWKSYMIDAVIETTLSRDVLQMEDVRKPALLRKLFILGCQFSAQELSYRKILGQLDDRGNAETIAHYLDLLNSAGLLCGMQKYDRKGLNTRKSSPRLMVFDTGLLSAASPNSEKLLNDPEMRGHFVESAVGAYLLAQSKVDRFEVFWWREGDKEVDFVISQGDKLTALEVKSGRVKNTQGILAFQRLYPEARLLVIGDRNNSLEDLLSGKIPLFV